MNPRANPLARRLALVIVAIALLPALACNRAKPKLPAPPISIVLLSLDTLRSDHLGCYGYARPTSPRLDALAKESVLFEHARTPVPWTTPAHMTMLTSLEPDVHKVTHTALAEVRFTGPERLRDVGYATGGFVNATALDHRFGFTRGFDAYEYTERKSGAAAVNQKALDWLTSVTAKDPAKPFFLFVHYYVVHNPYDPPPEFRAPFVKEYRPEDVTRTEIGPYHGPVSYGEAERRSMIDLYDGGVRYGDDAAGALLDGLARLGVLDRTAFFVTSDHGEGFGEHGTLHHGRRLYEELVRVPMSIRGPGLPERKIVDGSVSTADLLPTLLELAGLPIPKGVDGRSMRSVIDGGPGRPVYSEERRTRFETGLPVDDDLLAVRDERFSWIGKRDRKTGSVSEEAFDRSIDPGETSPLPGNDLAAWSAAFREAVQGARARLRK